MRAPVLVALLLVLVPLGARAAGEGERPPVLAFAETAAVFSSVVQGQKVSRSFRFTNAGGSELVVRRVFTSCGCTVGRIERDRVPPGESGAIELVLDSSEKLGPAVSVQATVVTNGGQQRLELRGEVVSLLRYPQGGLWFAEVARGRLPVSREWRVTAGGEARGFRVTGVETGTDWLAVEKRPLGPGEAPPGETGWSLVVTLLPGAPGGDFQRRLTVSTDVPRQPSVRLLVAGRVGLPVRGPDAVVLGRARRADGAEREVALVAEDGRTRRILAIDADPRFVHVSTDGSDVDAKARILAVRLERTAPTGPFAVLVRVRLDDPEVPLVTFSVSGEVLPAVQVEPPLVLVKPGQERARVSVSIEGGKLLGARVEPAAGAAAFGVALEKGGVALTRTAAELPERCELVLETDVPGEEQVRVPVARRGGA